jgi:hypothetical protein
VPNPPENVEHVVAADGRQSECNRLGVITAAALVFGASRIVGIYTLGMLRVITSTPGDANE